MLPIKSGYKRNLAKYKFNFIIHDEVFLKPPAVSIALNSLVSTLNPEVNVDQERVDLSYSRTFDSLLSAQYYKKLNNRTSDSTKVREISSICVFPYLQDIKDIKRLHEETYRNFLDGRGIERVFRSKQNHVFNLLRKYYVYVLALDEPTRSIMSLLNSHKNDVNFGIIQSSIWKQLHINLKELMRDLKFSGKQEENAKTSPIPPISNTIFDLAKKDLNIQKLSVIDHDYVYTDVFKFNYNIGRIEELVNRVREVKEDETETLTYLITDNYEQLSIFRLIAKRLDLKMIVLTHNYPKTLIPESSVELVEMARPVSHDLFARDVLYVKDQEELKRLLELFTETMAEKTTQPKRSKKVKQNSKSK